MATKKKKTVKKKSVTKKTATKKFDYSPARFLAYKSGGFGLFFSCDAFESIRAMALFEEVGAYGNGYGWGSVIIPALEATDAKAAKAIDCDCEADTFCARAKTEAPLRVLAGVIRDVTKSRATLKAALEKRDPNRD